MSMEVIILAQILQITRFISPNENFKVVISKFYPVVFSTEKFKQIQIPEQYILSTFLFRKDETIIILIIYPIVNESDDQIIQELLNIEDISNKKIKIIYYKNDDISRDQILENSICISIPVDVPHDMQWLDYNSFIEVSIKYYQFLNHKLNYVIKVHEYFNMNKFSDKFIINCDISSTKYNIGSLMLVYKNEKDEIIFFKYDVIKKNDRFLSEKPFPLIYLEVCLRESFITIDNYNYFCQLFIDNRLVNNQFIVIYKDQELQIFDDDSIESDGNFHDHYSYNYKLDYVIMENTDDKKIYFNKSRDFFNQISIDISNFIDYCLENGSLSKDIYANSSNIPPSLIFIWLIMSQSNLIKNENLINVFNKYKKEFNLDLQPESEINDDINVHNLAQDNILTDKLKNEAGLVKSLNEYEAIIAMIKDKTCKSFSFAMCIRKTEINMLLNLRDDGMNILHLIIKNNRFEFLMPLFRRGLWVVLTEQVVLNSVFKEYEGCTAQQLCTLLKNNKTLKEIDLISSWEKSLNPAQIMARNGDLFENRLTSFCDDNILHELDKKECSCLYWAVVNGNIDSINYLLEKKVDYNQVNLKGENLLHIAATIGHFYLYELLIGLKLDPLLKDKSKKTALSKVSENGDVLSLREFVRLGVDVKLFEPSMAIAGYYGQLDFLKVLIEEFKLNPFSKDDAGKSALLRSVDQNQFTTIVYLLNFCDNLTDHDSRKRNIVHVAAESCRDDIFLYILDKLKQNLPPNVFKSLLNKKDKYVGGELCMLIRGKDRGNSSWHYVEVHRNLMEIFMSKTKSGTIDIGKYGTLLQSGWGADPPEEVAQEIEHKFDVRRMASNYESDDQTPLHIAVFKNKSVQVEALLMNGAEVNTRDKFGLTALHLAAMRGNIDMAKMIIEKGGNVDSLDCLVKTPAEVAEENGQISMVNFLKGQMFLPIALDFRNNMELMLNTIFQPEVLQDQILNGQDFRTYLISSLRDLTLKINETLFSLQSGPITESTGT